MSADVEMHLVLAIPLEVDDDGTVIHAGAPYLVDENPFPVGLMGEVYEPETGRWHDSTEARTEPPAQPSRKFFGEPLKPAPIRADN